MKIMIYIIKLERGDYMEDLDYIKQFSKISITNACRTLKIDKSNLYSGKCKKDNIVKLKKYLESEVAKLYILKGDEDVKKNS